MAAALLIVAVRQAMGDTLETLLLIGALVGGVTDAALALTDQLSL